MAEEPSPPGVERLRLYYQLDEVEKYLPPLPADPGWAQFRSAFDVRDSLAKLFLGDDPFFRRPTHFNSGAQRGRVEEICNAVLAQGVSQHDRVEAMERNRRNADVKARAQVKGTIDGAWDPERERPHPGRPFIVLMGYAHSAPVLHDFVKSVALAMAADYESTRHHPCDKVWMGYENWNQLDPYRRAQVVLAAKAYSRLDHFPAGGHAATQHYSLAHSHVPSLTARQARRSAVEQQQLRVRWAA